MSTWSGGFREKLIKFHFGRLVHLIISFIIKITHFKLMFYEFQVHFLYLEYTVYYFCIVCKICNYLRCMDLLQVLLVIPSLCLGQL